MFQTRIASKRQSEDSGGSETRLFASVRDWACHFQTSSVHPVIPFDGRVAYFGTNCEVTLSCSVRFPPFTEQKPDLYGDYGLKTSLGNAVYAGQT